MRVYILYAGGDLDLGYLGQVASFLSPVSPTLG